MLASYRFRINNWFAADGSYGYTRGTQHTFTPAGAFNVQSNVHQATGALVITSLRESARLRPFALVEALIFDPTQKVGGFVAGADRQTKAAFVYGGRHYQSFNKVQWTGLPVASYLAALTNNHR